MSDGGASLQKHRSSTLRSLWSISDFAVCKIISALAKSRMQIFSNQFSNEHKQQMKDRVIKFVLAFIQHRTFKSLIKHLKTELPRLFGFGSAEIFMHDRNNKNLFCMSIRPDEGRDTDSEKKGFEEDFMIAEK